MSRRRSVGPERTESKNRCAGNPRPEIHAYRHGRSPGLRLGRFPVRSSRQVLPVTLLAGPENSPPTVAGTAPDWKHAVSHRIPVNPRYCVLELPWGEYIGPKAERGQVIANIRNSGNLPVRTRGATMVAMEVAGLLAFVRPVLRIDRQAYVLPDERPGERLQRSPYLFKQRSRKKCTRP